MMNRSFKSLFILACICSIVFTQGCGKDEESATERTNRLLRATTWELSKLTVDGTDQTSLYSDLVLSISPGTYTAENGEPVWPSAGTWELTDASTISRDNGMTIEINALDATTLILSFQWSHTTYSGGRTESVSGNHIFEFKKQ
jgi:hypothetical protein